MVMKLRIKHGTPWSTRPLWIRRVHGFCVYLFCAFMAIFWPVETDMAIFGVLSDQFEELR